MHPQKTQRRAEQHWESTNKIGRKIISINIYKGKQMHCQVAL